MDLKGGLVIIIQQAEQHFLLVDSVSGLQLISYEGRHICSIKQLGLLPDSLNPHTVTVCNDTVCILDQKDEKIGTQSLKIAIHKDQIVYHNYSKNQLLTVMITELRYCSEIGHSNSIIKCFN
ncbi:intraflagellar transport protein 80 homolog isoform X2 [Dysidea avara]|uniref:intraflagellar transport protein 80 homolog isoform X2 n=1 Tax=Dysidea avara TaxID=196820 RepID=UPI0033187E58